MQEDANLCVGISKYGKNWGIAIDCATVSNRDTAWFMPLILSFELNVTMPVIDCENLFCFCPVLSPTTKNHRVPTTCPLQGGQQWAAGQESEIFGHDRICGVPGRHTGNISAVQVEVMVISVHRSRLFISLPSLA
jgi:hypothetical protein